MYSRMMSRRDLRVLVVALIWMGVLEIPSCLNLFRKNELGVSLSSGKGRVVNDVLYVV
jgi:hypothetical protein